MKAHPYRLVCAAGLLLLGACGQSPSSPQSSPPPSAALPSLSQQAAARLQAYEELGRAYLQQLDNGAEADVLAPQAQQMLNLGLEVLPHYLEIAPACGDYLQAAANGIRDWPALSAEEIELDYHQDGALPEKPAGVDCYHMKDVIVHPATALVLLKDEPLDREQLRLEIFEVIAHAMAVRTGSAGYNGGDGD